MAITIQRLADKLGTKGEKGKYTGVIDYHGVPIEPWNHPKSIARYILKYVSHTYSYGMQIVAPMGHGKSTAATIIAHYIHKENPNYLVIWAEANDFRNLKRFLLSLPKCPMVIIFDDLSSALKEMNDKDMERNFKDLTEIRWIIDPQHGHIPTIIIANYHYSKNLEKEFRAVLGMTFFLAFGAEEHTNIDTILPKKTIGRKTLEHYSNISDKMFTQEKFQLMHSNGQVITYETDKPCRAGCAVMGKESRIILLSENDMCPKCAKKSFKKYVDPKKVYNLTNEIYPVVGAKAIDIALVKRGYIDVLPRKTATALKFVEDQLFSEYDIRLDKLVEYRQEVNRKRYKEAHEKAVTAYRKRKKEKAAIQELDKTVERVEIGKDEQTPPFKEDQTRPDSRLQPKAKEALKKFGFIEDNE